MRRWTTLFASLALLFVSVPALGFSIATVGGKEVKWSIFNVGYYLDTNGWSGISNGSDRQAIIAAFNDWQAVSCAKLKFNKLGDTTISNVLPTGADGNGKNELIWKEGYWPFGNNVLGVTSPLYGFSGTISEADIAFNGTIKWNTSGSMWYSTDVKSVGIHEIGHFFGLQHNLSFNENDPPTMAPYADPYGKSATLHQDDKNAICYLYPASSYSCSSASECPYVVMDNSQGQEYYASHYKCSSNKCVPETGSSGPGQLGANCTNDSSCNSGLFCVQTTEGNWCSQWCSVSGQDCPDGFGCFLVEQGSDEGICAGGQNDKVFGEYCFGDSDCKSPFFCLEWWSGPFCTKSCTDVDGGTGCPTGYTCYPSAESPSGGGACFPGTVSKKDDGKACSYSSDCKSGLCFPDPGTESKYCRTKCDPGAGTGCSGSFKCIAFPGDVTGTKGGCVPKAQLPEKADGASCDIDWQCASGYCYYDAELGSSTCRKTCNPASPNCPSGEACMEVGYNTGACLPAPDPQPEGSWCLHHYECTTGYCVALPGTDKKACRNACTSGSGCANGYQCVFYDDPGVGACMPVGKDLGEVCSSSTECTTQICWSQSGASVCLPPCGDAGCPDGFTCYEMSPYGAVCIEQAGTFADGAACVTDKQCLSGICLSGICRVPCLVLSPDCPAGQGCVPLNSGTSGACVAPGTGALGTACASDFACQSLLCVDLPAEARVCTTPCYLGSASCGPNRVCHAVPELTGLGACGQEVEEPPAQDVLEDPAPVENDLYVGERTGGMCTAGSNAPWSSAAMLFLLLVCALVRVRRPT
jgi:hypothetical protein